MTRANQQGGQDTRTRLLAAAERVLVERGITGLSVRKVGEAAGMNATLVTYHFGSIARLLEELCHRNMDPVLADWQAVDGLADLDAILTAWLRPMLRPAAFTPDGRALVVLDEIAAHGEGDLRALVLSRMEGFSRHLRAVLAPHVPHLTDDELRARLRFISGAALGPPPRGHHVPRFASGLAVDDMAYLLPFARAALA